MQHDQPTFANPAIVPVVGKPHFARTEFAQSHGQGMLGMTTLDVNAPKKRKLGPRRVISASLGVLHDLRSRWAAHRNLVLRARAAHHFAILSSMSDEQLADWGLKRADIHAHAYRNVPAE